MQLVCDECHDWPVTKRKLFVNYNQKLRSKREAKRRQARLASAASDQSVCDTDTDVPLEEPSVPVQDIDLDELNIGQQQCLTSEEVVIIYTVYIYILLGMENVSCEVAPINISRSPSLYKFYHVPEG